MSRKPTGRTIAQFEETHGQGKIQRLQRELEAEHAKVEQLSDVQYKTSVVRTSENVIRFALTGDRHTGSLYHRAEHLRAFYDYCNGQGVDTVYDCGDILDGHNIYKGQVFELRDVGFEAQIARMKSDAPQNILTRFITGNHDANFKQLCGVNVGKSIEMAVENYEFLGEEQARVSYETPNGVFNLDLIHPGGGSAYALCFSKDTEILTEDGWVKFPSLKRGVLVATLDRKTRELVWQMPTDYVNMPYDGDMLAFSSHHYDFVVTPDHRFFARRPWARWESSAVTGGRKNLGAQMVLAKDIKGRDWVIPKSCKWSSGVDPSIPFGTNALAFAQLVGWYISEGSRSKANHQIQIDQKDRGVLCEIAALAVECGFNPYTRKDAGRIIITHRGLYDWIESNCPGKSHEKRVPKSFMNATESFLSAFMTGYLRGDGCRTSRGWHSCTTVSRGLAGDIQEIALKLGFCACVKEQPGRFGNKINGIVIKTAKTRYQVSFNYEILEPSLCSPKRVPYTGNVYCVSVPNEVIMVRRNGKCAWSGNSYKPQKIIESLGGGTKPDMLANGHFHKAEMIPSYRNVCAVQVGTFQAQTPFMARQGLAAHVGGWIIEVVVGKGYKTFKGEFVAFYM